ncbi:hypothetical protein HK099_002912 [Clydaea vesicula]|uniref:Cyclin N-terminal domain-containing protein n=1 Tax=Clydaea vesicula TaxID=447962 RepID=A0AAD5U7H1_9FUNG|nr:hypothetical protein HK099_002912 [Clydaea vesicula]
MTSVMEMPSIVLQNSDTNSLSNNFSKTDQIFKSYIHPPRAKSILNSSSNFQRQNQKQNVKNTKRKPALVINTKDVNIQSSFKQPQQPLSCPLPNNINSNQYKLPMSPLSATSATMNPLQRLSNLASLMVYVIWFDIPLNKLLADWNIPGNRMKCEKVLSSTRLSPSVVVVGLKYLQRVKIESKLQSSSAIQNHVLKISTLTNGDGSNISNNTDDFNSTPKNEAFPNENSVWAACLLLAHKYLDDKHFSNPTFAQVNLITSKELNISEMECLKLLNFRLCILEEEYTLWRKNLQDIVTDSIKSINQNKVNHSHGIYNKEQLQQLPSLRGKSLTSKDLLFSPMRSRSPYPIPVSPGILNTPSNLWSPASPLVTGGPLRLGHRHRPIIKNVDTSNLLNGPRSAGLMTNNQNVNIFLSNTKDDSATYFNSSENNLYKSSAINHHSTSHTPGILRLSNLNLVEEKIVEESMDLS